MVCVERALLAPAHMFVLWMLIMGRISHLKPAFQGCTRCHGPVQILKMRLMAVRRYWPTAHPAAHVRQLLQTGC